MWSSLLLSVALTVSVCLLADGQELEVTVSPEKRSVAEGKDVGFECGYKLPPGHSFMSASWQNSRTGSPLPRGRHETRPDGILVLRRVTPAESGILTCAVQSSFRGRVYRGWAHATLTVVGDTRVNRMAPEVTVLPSGDRRAPGLIQVRPGGTVELSCMATGHPLPYKNWRRASGRSLPAGRHDLVDGKLTLRNIRVPDDVDEYECVATNDVGRAGASRFLVGGWAPWAEWGMCSVSCARGQQSRTRTCIVPRTLSSRWKTLACPGRLDTSTNTGTEARICRPGQCPPPPTSAPRPTRPPTTRRPAPTRPPRTQPPPRTPAPRTRPPATPAPRPVVIRTRPPTPRHTAAPLPPTPRAAPAPAAMAVGSGLKSVGCFRDHVARRVLRFHVRNFWSHRRQMNPQFCVRHCQRYGHRYAGVENHVECYCGFFDVNKAAKSSACTVPCGGNSGLACGGVNALSVYEVSQQGITACQATKWGRWTQLKKECGWQVQSRSRTLRNPLLPCPNIPRLRMERLIQVKPCRDFSLRRRSCGRVAIRQHLRWGLQGNRCTSQNEVTLHHCKGPCGGRCTYRKTTSVEVPFDCAGTIVHIRVAKILSCQCR